MRSKRFDVATVHIDGADVRIKYGDVLVVCHEGREDLDWEVVIMAFDPAPLEPAPYHLAAVSLDGTWLVGDAVLVRSIDGTHVFRGAGPLADFDDDLLE
jgi:hypothetical protein